MSQTPTPDSPQQPESSQPTQPLWYGEPSRQQPSPVGAAPSPAGPPYGAPPPGQPHAAPWVAAGGTAQPPRGRRRRWTEITSVAALAAVLASGTTYAVTRGDVTADTSTGAVASTSRVTESAPVAQANAQAPNWSATAGAVSPSVVAITVKSSQGGAQGSGVLIDAKGHIVTNNHVVAGAGGQSQLSVTLNDGRTYSAERRRHRPLHRPGRHQARQRPLRPHADPRRRRRRAQGRRPGHGGRQPARAGRHRHHRHRQRAEPAGHHQPEDSQQQTRSARASSRASRS